MGNYCCQSTNKIKPKNTNNTKPISTSSTISYNRGILRKNKYAYHKVNELMPSISTKNETENDNSIVKNNSIVIFKSNRKVSFEL